MSLYRVFIELRTNEGCYWLPTTWNADTPEAAADLALQGFTARNTDNHAILNTAEVFDIEAGAKVFHLRPTPAPLYQRVDTAEADRLRSQIERLDDAQG